MRTHTYSHSKHTYEWKMYLQTNGSYTCSQRENVHTQIGTYIKTCRGENAQRYHLDQLDRITDIDIDSDRAKKQKTADTVVSMDEYGIFV